MVGLGLSVGGGIDIIADTGVLSVILGPAVFMPDFLKQPKWSHFRSDQKWATLNYRTLKNLWDFHIGLCKILIRQIKGNFCSAPRAHAWCCFCGWLLGLMLRVPTALSVYLCGVIWAWVPFADRAVSGPQFFCIPSTQPKTGTWQTLVIKLIKWIHESILLPCILTQAPE